MKKLNIPHVHQPAMPAVTLKWQPSSYAIDIHVLFILANTKFQNLS